MQAYSQNKASDAQRRYVLGLGKQLLSADHFERLKEQAKTMNHNQASVIIGRLERMRDKRV